MSVSFQNNEEPAFRTRAYTTGSMWEILKKKRQVVEFHHNVLSKSVFLGPRSGITRQDRAYSRSMDNAESDSFQGRRHRRRHWSELNTSGSKETKMPTFPDAIDSSNEDSHMDSTVSDVPRIRVSTTRDYRALGRTPDVSPILYRKQRTNSLPSDMSTYDGRDMIESMYLCYRYSAASKGMMYLGESLRSITRERHSSIGSTTSCNDDDVISREESNTSGGTTFNVSSTSSICVPAITVLILGQCSSEVSAFTELIVSLGETDDEDDVFMGKIYVVNVYIYIYITFHTFSQFTIILHHLCLLLMFCIWFWCLKE